ncbi:tagaturonate reductase [Olivibacter domesticus]|uniref:Tagaturonate reductase n=1 Tax=Olivibacter domesticus TaxID=407022 RepID=A0A1H7QBY9_OLID1|nr:tagaturonate reductase [Olivibacter domesticus]SEL45630.1 tagaturonate reductase [Olivibacter domesticus]
MERLNNKFLQTGSLPAEVLGPVANWNELPVKVIQFGTGVLLRGLPDYFIDKANRAGIFNGRIVVVKSTSTGKTDSFNEQDGLYTLCVKGIEDGKDVEEYLLNSSIKEVLSAQDNWHDIMQYALDPEMKVVISNTTEVGIVYDKNDNILAQPPASFPGKLLAFLYARFKHFEGSKASGLVVVPTELISDNGLKLKNILLQLASEHLSEEKFISWLNDANYFCNSLVDRIVPGKLPYEEHQSMEKKLGYKDELMIMAEPFRLWAIEAKDPYVKEVLSFSTIDEGLVITGDISKFKELKLRLLNGTHTFTCGLAVLAGFETVKEAMANPLMEHFITNLLMQEIVPTVVGSQISKEEADVFAGKVLDRFRNKSLDHKWINITLNYTSKMEMRNVALLKGYYKGHNASSQYMALGFAAYLLFMKGKKSIDNTYKGYVNNRGYYAINDESAEIFENLWNRQSPEQVVDDVLKNQRLWNVNLSTLPTFGSEVKKYLHALMNKEALDVISEVVNNKEIQSV